MTAYTVASGVTSSGLVISGGDTLVVASGGTVSGLTVLSGGSATISGLDSGSTVAAGGNELVYGSAVGDIVAGVQTVSTTATQNGLVSNETVTSGGLVFLSIKSTSGSAITVLTGGTLGINGAISATNTTLSGGTVNLESAKATLTGSLVFAGGGTLDVTGNTSAGSGDLAIISGFGSGAVIDITSGTTLGAATSDTLTTSVVSGVTSVTVSGGGVSDTFLFAGTTIGASLVLKTDGNGGQEIILPSVASGSVNVSSGVTSTGIVAVSGSTTSVYAGGSLVSASVLSGGSVVVASGGSDSGSVISSGGSETVQGSASGDNVYGSQTVSAGGTASAETVQSGGSVTVLSGGNVSGVTVSSGAALTLSGTARATSATIAGGTVTVGTSATLAGGFRFNGFGTLNLASPSVSGAGDQAPISGFYYGDVVNLTGIGSGATLSSTVAGGNTVVTVTSGATSETLSFAGAVTNNLTLVTSGGVAQIDYVPPPTTTTYTPGNLVLSIYGDGAGTGVVGLDQAAPITLEQITQTGSIVSIQVLPTTTSVVNGTTEFGISGEYQSASEGILSLAVNGQSLSILGYGVNDQAFNAANAAAVYGTTAEGQTNNIPSSFTQVQRVVANISFNGSVDTSTSISGIFNTNNPRSVATINGTTFYLGGQGNGNDGTEGVWVAADGASNATAIWNNKTDVRDVAIYNGQLYVGVDSKSNGGAGLYNFGSTLPTGQTAPIQLPGIGASITLTAGEANTVNAAAVGTSVNLSPEQYFFANPTTLYIADGGVPKEGGTGDGGLQKWSLINNSWTLDYTLSQGLNLVSYTVGAGSTGLVGLTGSLDGKGNVVLYASNETAAETDPTFLYGITDVLSATTAPTGESFTLLQTAAPGTLIRGVAFAPTATASVTQIASTVTISGGVSSGGLVVQNPGNLVVQSGGTISGTTLLSGATATISSGGSELAGFVAHGATETVLGSAAGDIIDGVQTLAAGTAVVIGETIENGGTVNVTTPGAIASSVVVNSGGTLNVSGRAFATNAVINGGALVLATNDATVASSIAFSATGDQLVVSSASVAGAGITGVISNFGSTDVIDERGVGAGARFSTTISGGNVVAVLSSGGVTESFAFAGSSGVTGAAYASGLSTVADGSGGTEIIYTPPTAVVITVSSGVTSSGLLVTSGNSVVVQSGGTIVNTTIQAGGSAVISVGATDSGATILSGGFEIVSGSAIGDKIYGIQDVTTGASGGTLPATVSGETVFNGGTLELYLKPDTATNTIVSSGGVMVMSGNVSGTNTTLEAGAYLALQSPKATLSGGLVFQGAATVAFTTNTSAGFGAGAVGSGTTVLSGYALISGFGAGDVIDETLISSGSAVLTTTTSGGNTIETITGGTYPQYFVFSGTNIASHIQMIGDGTGGVELAYLACFATGTRIAVPGGQRAVEEIAAGDVVTLATGGWSKVVWAGRRTLDLRRHARPEQAQPILIEASAIADGVPARDLLVSPDHAIFLDGHLIPAKALQNGASIRQLDLSRVTYHHIELVTHGVVLAEGLAAESYLETGNRNAFEGHEDSLILHPDFAQTQREQTGCAPFAESGAVVEAVRTRLLERAALTLGDDPELLIIHGEGGAMICSRSARPGDISPDPRDLRRLGVKVAQLMVDGRTIPLDHPGLVQGWHDAEADGRWTDGGAVVPASLLGGGTLTVTLAATLAYPAPQRPEIAARA